MEIKSQIKKKHDKFFNDLNNHILISPVKSP